MTKKDEIKSKRQTFKQSKFREVGHTRKSPAYAAKSYDKYVINVYVGIYFGISAMGYCQFEGDFDTR